MLFDYLGSYSRYDWAGGDEFFGAGVDAEVEAFEGATAEEEEVAGFGEDDFVGGFGLVDAEEGVADGAGDDLAVGHADLDILFAAFDAEFVEDVGVNPGEFGAGVHHEFGDD